MQLSYNNTNSGMVGALAAMILRSYRIGRLFFAVLPALLLLGGCESGDEAGLVRPAVIAGTTFPNTEGERHWLRFRDGVTAASDGSLPLRMLIYGQLGSEDQLLSGLRRGRVQFANLSAMAVSTVVPEMALLYAPFLFDDEAEADYVYDHLLTDLYRELLAEKGLHLVSWYEIGFIEVYGKQPLLAPTDAVGRRFRVGSGPAARLFAEALQADVIPLGFADVVSSLQTGLIEAGENAVSLYARTGIAGEAGHLTITDHSFGVSGIVASKAWWDGLTDEQREIVSSSWPAIAETRRAVRKESAQDLEQAESLGFSVHRLTATEREQWRIATDLVTGQLISKIGGQSQEVYDQIQKLRAVYRAQQTD
jgi:TRAP-type C4-dicarboxylate transport system substrate-binding protein